MEGKEVKRWVGERERLSKEIARVSSSLSKPLPIRVQQEWAEKKKGLDAEKRLIEGRIKEFESALECMLQYLEENNVEGGGENDDAVPVFRFGGGFDWKQLHCLIVRERRRLEEGLPIYAYRREILQEIHHMQVSSYRNLREKK